MNTRFVHGIVGRRAEVARLLVREAIRGVAELAVERGRAAYVHARGADPSAAGGGQVRKILIVMSDGDNYVAPRLDGSIYKEYHDNHDVPMADAWTREACEHTRSRGVEVFSIAYGKEISANGKKVLQDCASSSAHYFDAASASALNTTFQKIAESITRLRLVK